MKHLAAAFLACAAFGSARASTISTDMTDLWWVGPQENGWGVNIVDQYGTLFLTFFVYDEQGHPHWYVGSNVGVSDESNPEGFIYDGPLYETHGPWWAAPYDPTTFGLQEVGHVQVFNFGSTALLRYSVNGTQVQKSIVRQTWRRNALSGSYVGAFIGTYSAGCQAVGYAEEPFTGSVGESAESITLIGTTSLGACTYTGPYVQRGRFGEVVGTFQCTNGEAGQFRAYEIDGSRAGFSAQATITAGAGCSWAGHFGGLRRQ
jgi:hypothetical protein